MVVSTDRLDHRDGWKLQDTRDTMERDSYRYPNLIKSLGLLNRHDCFWSSAAHHYTVLVLKHDQEFSDAT